MTSRITKKKKNACMCKRNNNTWFHGGWCHVNKKKKNACITTITTNKSKQPHEQNFDG